jgi:hypothetical protein
MLDKIILKGAINKKFTDFSDSIQLELNTRLTNHHKFKNYANEFDKIQSTKQAYAEISENMNEAKRYLPTDRIYIQPEDISGALNSLKKSGIEAKSDGTDEIQIKTKDKKKVIKWLLSNDYTTKEIKDMYPQLSESVNEAKPRIISIPTEYDAIVVVNQLGRVGLKARASSSNSESVNVDIYNLDDQQKLLDWMDSKGYDKKDIKNATLRRGILSEARAKFAYVNVQSNSMINSAIRSMLQMGLNASRDQQKK